MNQSFADIALPVPLDHTFTYSIPLTLQPLLQRGSRVLVPFGKKMLTGVVVGTSETSSVRGIKPIADVLDATPAFSAELLHLCTWMSEYYLAPLGEVIRAASPHGAARESKRIITLTVENVAAALADLKPSARKQRAMLTALQGSPVQTVAQLREKTKAASIHALLNELALRGWVRIEEELQPPKASIKREKMIWEKVPHADALAVAALTPKQQQVFESLRATKQPVPLQAFLKLQHVSSSVVTTLAKRGMVTIAEQEVVRSVSEETIPPPRSITLNEHQQQTLDAIRPSIDGGEYATFLLHGVTGSGKTQVYIEAMRHTLSKGKTAIVLVPEISLTPQTVRRFKAHFGSDVAVMHSQMSAGERFDAWRLAHEERVKIVIGPRSAIFAPLANIGLIVVDEEHEGSYKQYDATPRYNARDVAVVRASALHAVVILGSATPSSESYYNALSGKYRLLELPERVDNATLPAIAIVDMAKDRRAQYAEIKERVKAERSEFPKQLPHRSISALLKEHIIDRLRRKEGIILLQNRRGFSHIVECFDCGYVERCDNCDVSLTYHATKKHLRCHYCGIVKKPPTECPSCHGAELRYYAFGTQQVEEELHELFPDGRIVRMDKDTTSRKGAHERILRQFADGEADILLGTQMVAKGLDFPRVTLVGVISADTQMLLPDFRASEQTFQLLTQVAGRAGRSVLAGEVVIQTLQPDHYSLKHVEQHDFQSFYTEELEYRRELDYPPFSRIVLIECTGASEADVEQSAQLVARTLRGFEGQKAFTVLGPADAAIPRLRGQYRKHVVVKDLKSKDPAGKYLRGALSLLRSRVSSATQPFLKRTKLTIDIDPFGMM